MPPMSLPPDRTVACKVLGCKANQEEMEALMGALGDAGYRVVPFGEPADWTVVNTCTVTGSGDAASRQAVRAAVRSGARAGGRVVATGCLAQRDARGLAAIEGVDWVVGNAEKARLAEWILEADGGGAAAPAVRAGSDPTLPAFASHGLARAGCRARASLKIQDGCGERCTFCVIPRVRGASRSRPLEDVLSQARTLVAAGCREIALTGINTALWGRDLPGGADLLDLLRALVAVPGLARVRLNSLEPQYVSERWLDAVAGLPGVCRHFHLPLQSGSAGTLRRMNRRYTPRQYEKVVRGVRARMPEASVGCDVMAGFPGESEAAFGETADLLRSLQLSYLHVFPYDPRPGTAAPRLGPPAPPAVARERVAALRALDTELRARFAASQRDTLQWVVPEAACGDGAWQGLTGNYLRVRFPVGDGAAAVVRGGEPLPVLLGAALPSGSLAGRLLASSPPEDVAGAAA